MHTALPSVGDMLLEITGECNYKCVHCSARAGSKHSREFSVGELKHKVLGAAHEFGLTNVVFSGGEPLLRKSTLFELIRYSTKALGINAYAVTNASLVNKEVAKELKKTGLKKLWILLYGSRAETHEAVTQITVLVGEGVNVGLHTVFMRSNYKDLPELVAFAKSLGIPTGSEAGYNAEPAINVFRISPAGRGRDNFEKQRLDPQQCKEFAQAMRKEASSEGMTVLPAGWARPESVS